MLSLASITVLLGVSVVLGIRVIEGSPPGHSLLNLESAVALAFLLVVFLCPLKGPLASGESEQSPWSGSVHVGLLAFALPLVVSSAYLGIIHSPFVFDDYTHIFYASSWNWRTALAEFGPVQHKPGLFYRPLGFFLYWLTYLWAGTTPWRWHAASIVLHGTNTFLVYFLCRKLNLASRASLAAAAIFGMSGATAEAVAWIDARFDLLATAFTLTTLICICQYLEAGKRVRLAVGLISTLAAVLSKESAICLPLLVLLLFPFFDRRKRMPRIWIAFLCIAGLCCAAFAYRWWAVGGIGGYKLSNTGTPALIVHRLNALLIREWAILFFPVNWSTPAGHMVRAIIAIFPVVLGFLALGSRPPRPQFAACLGFVVAAALPAQKMLLIGSDLSGARALYLPGIGLAVLWGLLLNHGKGKQRTLLACSLLITNAVLLQHNLGAWRKVPALAASACKSLGKAVGGADVACVRGLPPTEVGVVFLANGFPECVQMNSGVNRERVKVQDKSGLKDVPRNVRVFVWNDTRHQFQESGPGASR
jgi:hypothetical protein